MAKELTILTNTYEYPDSGENPGYGEDATAWAEAVTEVLNNIQSDNDIVKTSATILNNTTGEILGLLFNLNAISQFEITYSVVRTFDSGASVVSESGIILGTYDGSEVSMTQESVGDAGISFSIDSLGQFSYTSSDLTDHTNGVITFKASTL